MRRLVSKIPSVSSATEFPPTLCPRLDSPGKVHVGRARHVGSGPQIASPRAGAAQKQRPPHRRLPKVKQKYAIVHSIAGNRTLFCQMTYALQALAVQKTRGETTRQAECKGGAGRRTDNRRINICVDRIYLSHPILQFVFEQICRCQADVNPIHHKRGFR